MSPFKSDDLTELVTPDGDEFIVLRSPEKAEHDPDYEEIAQRSPFGRKRHHAAGNAVARDRPKRPSKTPLQPLRQKTNFLNPIKLIWVVQSGKQK